MSTAVRKQEGVGKESTALAALSRALVNSFIFFFKRPIRLFRPVKISAFQGISHLANQTRSSVFQTIRNLIQKEGIWRFTINHLAPPFVVNTLTGFVLFTTYTTVESYLTSLSLNRQNKPSLSSPSTRSTSPTAPQTTSLPTQDRIIITFLAGAVAGAAQSIISSPLDNVRTLLAVQERRGIIGGGGGVFRGWPHLIWSAITIPQLEIKTSLSSSSSSSHTAATTEGGSRKIDLSLVRRGWNFYGLSLVKDSIAFGMFFLTFQIGRHGARSVGLSIDSLSSSYYSSSDNSSADDERNTNMNGNGKVFDGGKLLRIGKERTTSGLIVQSGLILLSGTAAGWIFGFVSRPFDRVREVLHEGRSGSPIDVSAVGGRERGKERGVIDLLREAKGREGSWKGLLWRNHVRGVRMSRIQIAHLPVYFPTPSPRSSHPNSNPNPSFRTNPGVDSRWRRMLMKSGRVLKYAPIYSVGYFVFALVSGDLE